MFAAPAAPRSIALPVLALWLSFLCYGAAVSVGNLVSSDHLLLENSLSTSPRHLRLSFSDRAGQLVVAWSTDAPSRTSCVQLWPQPACDNIVGCTNALPAGRRSGIQLNTHSSTASLQLSTNKITAKYEGSSVGLHSSAGGSLKVGMGCAAHSVAAASNRKLAGMRGQLHVGQVLGGGEAKPSIQTVCGVSRPFREPSTNDTTLWLHEVQLPWLDPGRQYLYRVGAEGEGWSEWVNCRGPRSGQHFSGSRPASLLVVGDLGYLNSQTVPDLVREVEGGDHDALLHIGDIAYDLQSLEGRRASQFLTLVEPLTSRLPYLVLPGNHDVHHNLTHYRRLFSMPNRSLGDGLFYSFDLGPLHVLVYNTEVLYWPELYGLPSMDLMYRWMEEDLKAVNSRREQTPWVLVAGHRPMYCVHAKGGSCDWGWSREHEASRRGIPSRCSPHQPLYCPPTHAGGDVAFPIEELFGKYGVDLAVYGHSHCYERYFPVLNLTVRPGLVEAGAHGVYWDPEGTIHVTSGAGGNSEMKRGKDPPPAGPCNDTSPWCAFQSGFAPQGQQSSDYSYSRVRAFNATHLLWEQYSSTLGSVVDSWWVVQHRHGPFPLHAKASQQGDGVL